MAGLSPTNSFRINSPTDPHRLEMDLPAYHPIRKRSVSWMRLIYPHEVENDMPVNGRRKLPRPARDSDWTSTIPSAYSISFYDSSNSPYTKATAASINSFNRYVEGQRLRRGLKGSRSLKDVAIEVLIRNLSELDTLNDVPKHLTKCLWETLKRRCMLSFHSWKVLSKALHKEEDVTFGMLHYSKTIKSPKSPLQVYTKPLISKTFDFITSLSINVNCPVVDLVQLAKISNLGILEIINPDPWGETPSGVGDIVLRAWSREAGEISAFSVLRILRLWNHEDLTENSLQHIRSFPALALFDVRNCGISNHDKMVLEAEKLGWVIIPNKDLLDVLEEKCIEKQKVPAGSSFMPQPAERRFTKALWPGSRVRRVERSDVQSFFAQSGISSDNHSLNNNQLFNNGHILWATNSVDTDTVRWPDYVKDVTEGDEQWVSLSWDIFCNTRDKELWETSYAACWTRIGELREDQDLIMAGVRGIEKQTFVGPHLVSPVPMAYIRLGDVHQSWELWESNSTKLLAKSLDELPSSKNCLAFVRNGKNSRSALQSKNDFQLDGTSDGKRKAGGPGRMRASKKQKLDDVLNGFKAG